MNNNNLKTKLTTAAALVALSVGANQAFAAVANTSADATIYNEVVVSYQAAGGSTTLTAKDWVAVTVELVQSPVIVSDSGITESASTNGIYNSYFAIDATTNGDDDYTFTIGQNSIDGNLSSPTYTYRYTDNNNSSASAFSSIGGSGVDFTLASAISVGVQGDDTLLFPGGSLSATGFAVDDYVNVNGVIYKVAAINLGNAPVFGDPTTTLETLDELQLKNVDDSVILPASALTTPSGTVIAERIYLQVRTESVNTGTSTENVKYNLNVTDQAGNGINSASSEETVPFEDTSLSIVKEVSNDDASWETDTASFTVKPGDTLYYRITLTIADDKADAESVIVTDDLPAYTAFTDGSFSISYTPDGGTEELVTEALNNDSIYVVNGTLLYGDFDGTTVSANLGVVEAPATISTSGGTMSEGDVVVIKYEVVVD